MHATGVKLLQILLEEPSGERTDPLGKYNSNDLARGEIRTGTPIFTNKKNGGMHS